MATPPAHIRRVIFMGTPDLAVPPLLALHHAGYDIPLVVTRPDRRRTRRGGASPSPVKSAATELRIPVSDSIDDICEVEADLAVVVAYGQIIATTLLERLAMVNIHFSLLPRWRGAAPVERAILAGDAKTGVCLISVEPELDTGAVYRRQETPIHPSDTLASLRARLVDIGTGQLIDALHDGLGVPQPQTGEPVYAKKIKKSELEIDWTQSGELINRLIRVGGAWTTWRGRRLKVNGAEVVDEAAAGPPGSIDGTTVATGNGGLKLVIVQSEGKGPVAADAWVNGAHPTTHDLLGQ